MDILKRKSILLDIGGSGVKGALCVNGQVGKVINYGKAKTVTSLASIIRNVAGSSNSVRKISISIAAFVDPERGKILRCRCAEGLEGDICYELRKEFPRAAIHVINDGEAHARSLLYPGRNVRFGAIHFAFGTSVSFGVIDEKKQIIRACNGGNWDIGDFELKTRKVPYEVWYKLGSAGLMDLENDKEIHEPYYHFGARMGSFLRNFAVIFRPRTIGLSGGIVLGHEAEIMRGIREEFRTPPFADEIKIEVVRSQNAAMEGLTTL